MADRQASASASVGTQLALLDAPASSWRLDDKTREVGRRGLAEARAVLRSAGAGERRSGLHPGTAEAA